jgi:hypothetical protein
MLDMFMRIRAFLARRKIPRCSYCGLMIDAKPAFVGYYVCNDPDCRELAELESHV